MSIMRVYIFLLLLLLIACNEKKEQVITKSLENSESIATKLDSANQIEKKDIDTSKNSIADEEYIKPRVKVNIEKNLTKEQLVGFLPKSINGFETVTPTTASIQENDSIVIVTAKGQYNIKGSRSLILIDINDYGINSENFLSGRYKKLPSEPGTLFESISEAGIKGYFKWQDAYQSGVIRFTINNRFEVIIRADKTTFEKFKSYINLVDFNKIKSIK